MTIGEVARNVVCNPHYVKGLVHGLKIETYRSGRSTLINRADFKKIEEEIVRRLDLACSESRE